MITSYDLLLHSLPIETIIAKSDEVLEFKPLILSSYVKVADDIPLDQSWIFYANLPHSRVNQRYRCVWTLLPLDVWCQKEKKNISTSGHHKQEPFFSHSYNHISLIISACMHSNYSKEVHGFMSLLMMANSLVGKINMAMMMQSMKNIVRSNRDCMKHDIADMRYQIMRCWAKNRFTICNIEQCKIILASV